MALPSRPETERLFFVLIPAGEENKNLDQIRNIYSYLIENKFDRKSILVALGAM